MRPPDSTVGAYEAKTHFSQLLERVERGEEITITRHGTPVARLVPMRTQSTPEERAEAFRIMGEIASRNSLGGLRIKDLKDEGRP